MENKRVYSVLIGAIICISIFTYAKNTPTDLSSSETTKRELKDEKGNQQTKKVIKRKEVQVELQESVNTTSCQLFEQQKPIMNPIFEYFLEEHYMSVGDLTAEGGAYTTMDLASLKSLANAQDDYAMLIYGSALYWQAVSGVDIYKIGFDTNHKTTEEAQNHKVDVKMLEEAENYMFEAAVLGRVGAVMEISATQNMLQRKYIRHSESTEKVRALFIKDLALKSLFKQIHKNDEELLGGFDEKTIHASLKKNIAKWLDTDDQNKIKEEYDSIVKDAIKSSEDLEMRWKERRSYFGLEAFPRLQTPELKAYMKLQNQCNNPQ